MVSMLNIGKTAEPQHPYLSMNVFELGTFFTLELIQTRVG